MLYEVGEGEARYIADSTASIPSKGMLGMSYH